MKELANTPAIAVFLGTLPLLAALVLLLLDQRSRFAKLETKVDEVLKELGAIRERLTRVETRIEGAPRLVTGD